MRIQKKIVRTILALLPVMGMLFMFATSFNAKTETYPSFSRVRFNEVVGSDPYLTFEVPDSFNAKIIGAMYSPAYSVNAEGTMQDTAGSLKGACAVLARFANNLQNVTGISMSYSLICFWYAFYLFFIELSFMIINIITFVPRKCSEIFGG